MTAHPPYYFLDFWALVITGSAAFAFIRSRRRKHRSRTGPGPAHGGAHAAQDPAGGGTSGHRTTPVQRPDESRQPRDRA
jgi:hypothetical protein